MDLEGGAISPTRALSMLLPKGEVLLFKVIKKSHLLQEGGTSQSSTEG